MSHPGLRDYVSGTTGNLIGGKLPLRDYAGTTLGTTLFCLLDLMLPKHDSLQLQYSTVEYSTGVLPTYK